LLTQYIWYQLVYAVLFLNRNISIPAGYSHVYFSISKTGYQYLETRAIRVTHSVDLIYGIPISTQCRSCNLRAKDEELRRTSSGLPAGATHKPSIQLQNRSKDNALHAPGFQGRRPAEHVYDHVTDRTKVSSHSHDRLSTNTVYSPINETLVLINTIQQM